MAEMTVAVNDAAFRKESIEVVASPGPDDDRDGTYYWNAVQLAHTFYSITLEEINALHGIDSSTYWTAGRRAEVRSCSDNPRGFKLSLDGGDTFYDLGYDTTVTGPFYVDVPAGISGTARLYMYNHRPSDVRVVSTPFTVGPPDVCRAAIVGQRFGDRDGGIDVDSTWQARLAREWAYRDTRRELVDFSAPAATSAALDAQLKEALALSPGLIIASVMYEDVVQAVPLDSQYRRYDALIARAEAAGARVVILPPFLDFGMDNATQVLPVSDSLAARYPERFLFATDALFGEIAPFGEIALFGEIAPFGDTLRAWTGTYFDDGNRVNNRGQGAVAERLLSAGLESALSCPVSSGTRDGRAAPTPLTLEAFPNPTSGATDTYVRFTLPDDGASAALTVADALGRTLHTSPLGRMVAGEHVFGLPLRGLPAGVYVVSLRVRGGQEGGGHVGAVRLVVR